jgi:hypothetical protein
MKLAAKLFFLPGDLVVNLLGAREPDGRGNDPHDRQAVLDYRNRPRRRGHLLVTAAYEQAAETTIAIPVGLFVHPDQTSHRCPAVAGTCA